MTGPELQAALLDTQEEFTSAHQDAQWATSAYEETKRIYDAAWNGEMQIVVERAAQGDKALSNDDKRKAAAKAALAAHYPGLIDRMEVEAAQKYEAVQRVERLHEALKTYRAALDYEARTLELEAAQAHAQTLPRLVRNR